MALSAALEWEVRTGGSNNNGGAFKRGASGTDRSQQDAAHATLTTASVVNATTTIIDVAPGDYTVTAQDVGNVLQVTGGTATATFYEITVADTVNNRWTVDKSVGTAGQTVVGKMGGGLADLGYVGSAPLVDEQMIWIQAGAYLMTSASANVAGGTFSKNGNVLKVEGYQTTHGDLGTRPTITVSGAISGFTMIALGNANGGVLSNVELDGASKASLRGANVYFAYRCKGSNFTNNAFRQDNNGIFDDLEVTGCSSANAVVLASGGQILDSYIHDNTVVGLQLAGINASAFNCRLDTNTGAGNDGILISGAFGNVVRNCTIYNSGRHGVNASTVCLIENTLSEGNGTNGYNFSSAGARSFLLYCGAFGNGGSKYAGDDAHTTIRNFADNTTGTFFNDAANGDFTLNDLAGQGALARATGYPSYVDMGALQHADPSSGGGTRAAGFSS